MDKLDTKIDRIIEEIKDCPEKYLIEMISLKSVTLKMTEDLLA
jgi:hypothetical protein